MFWVASEMFGFGSQPIMDRDGHGVMMISDANDPSSRWGTGTELQPEKAGGFELK
jgi:hypothetical protein